ncbi:hypothetical protein [Butyrivibrio sp. MC2021]|uniref:hypothetical protein n=1 Tax=Butyrivibrio sp. MC2021 TaxID=1408306 RepID=UPI0004793F7A|nr:hypothetical protein [Butyrivibrio sp. MC2021]
MNKEFEVGTYTEDDRNIIPEYMLKMSVEELEQAAEKVLQEAKANPKKRERQDSLTKFNI